MKRWLLFLFLLIATAIPASAQITLVGGCAATATSCTPVVKSGQTFATGQFVYTFAYRSATTAPTLPSGYTTLDTASASSSSFRSGCAVMTTATPPASMWTNATRVLTLVYSGAAATTTATCVSAGIGGRTSAGTSGTTSTYTYTTVTLANANASSWVISVVGSSAAACTPTGLTSEYTASSLIIASDTAAPVTSFATKTCTGTTGNWKSDTVELKAAANTAPVASPAGGTYNTTQSAPTLTSNTGTTICYAQCTTAGCTATTPTSTTSGTCSVGTSISSGSAVSTAINNSGQIKSLATRAGFANSAVTTSTYTIQGLPPTYSPVAGTYASSQTVTITAPLSGSTICYSTTTTPAATTPGTCSTGTTLTSGGTVTISTVGTTTLRALATKANVTNSTVTTGAYIINGALAAPTYDHGTGSYSGSTTVTISKPTGSTVCYTVDGSTPAATTAGTCSTGLTYSSAITISTTGTVLKSIATQATWLNSSETDATYTITAPVPHWLTWNGSTIGSGHVVTFNGITIGTGTGNIKAWNGLAASTTSGPNSFTYQTEESAYAPGNASSVQTTGVATTTGWSALVCQLAPSGTSQPTVVPTDTAGDTFTWIPGTFANDGSYAPVTYCAFAPSITGNSLNKVTATWPGSYAYPNVVVAYFLAGSMPSVDVALAGPEVFDYGWTTPVFSTAHASELITVWQMSNNTYGILSAGVIGGTMSTLAINPGGANAYGMEYLNVSTLQTSITGYFGSSNNSNARLIVISFY